MPDKKYKNVRSLQKFLKKEGYDPGAADNIWGPNTEDALKLYMSRNVKHDGTSIDIVTGAYKLLPLPLRSFIEDIGVSQFNKISPIEISQDALTESDLKRSQLDALRGIVRTNLGNNKNTISYSDYGTNENDSYEDVSSRASNKDIALKGFFDPNYQLKTTLGQADIFTTPTDTFVVDQGYNFNDGQGKSVFNPYAWKDASEEIGSEPSLYTVPRKIAKQFGSVEGEGRGALINISERKYGGQVTNFENGGETDPPTKKGNKLDKNIGAIDAWHKQYLNGPNYKRMSDNYEQTHYPHLSRDRVFPSDDTDYPRNIFPSKEAGLSFSKDQVYIKDSDGGSNFSQVPSGFGNPRHDWKKMLGFGKYGKEDRTINMYTNGANEDGRVFNFDEVAAHEYGHVDHDDTTGDKKIDEKLLDMFNPVGRSEYQVGHDESVGEIRSDVMALRYLLHKEGMYDSVKGGEFTQDMLEKFVKTQGSKPKPTEVDDIPWSQRLRKNFKDEDIVWMMNNLAQNETKGPNVNARNGGKVTKYQHGGETDPPVKKKKYEEYTGPTFNPYEDLYSESDNTSVYNNTQETLNTKVKAPFNPLLDEFLTDNLEGYESPLPEYDGPPAPVYAHQLATGAITPHNILPELLLQTHTVGAGLKVLRNYNSARFTANTGSLYRGIGQEGLDDALKSGILRARQNVPPRMSGNYNIAKDFNKVQKGVYASPNIELAKKYGKGVVSEIPEGVAKFRNRYRGDPWSQRTNDIIPLDKINLFKQNYFGKYNPVKQMNGGKVTKFQHGGSHVEPPTNADKARKYRMMRPAQGENYGLDFEQAPNTHSTHLSRTYEADGKYYSAPSITNDRAPYADNIYHPQSFRQAMTAGEGIPFDTEGEASKFAGGSWKLPQYPRPNFENGGPHDPPAITPTTNIGDWAGTTGQGSRASHREPKPYEITNKDLDSFESVNQDQIRYMNSPVYLERLRAEGVENPEEIRDLRIANINNTTIQTNRGDFTGATPLPNREGQYGVNFGEDLQDVKELYPGTTARGVYSHEISHVAGANNNPEANAPLSTGATRQLQNTNTNWQEAEWANAEGYKKGGYGWDPFNAETNERELNQYKEEYPNMGLPPETDYYDEKTGAYVKLSPGGTANIYDKPRVVAGKWNKETNSYDEDVNFIPEGYPEEEAQKYFDFKKEETQLPLDEKAYMENLRYKNGDSSKKETKWWKKNVGEGTDAYYTQLGRMEGPDGNRLSETSDYQLLEERRPALARAGENYEAPVFGIEKGPNTLPLEGAETGRYKVLTDSHHGGAGEAKADLDGLRDFRETNYGFTREEKTTPENWQQFMKDYKESGVKDITIERTLEQYSEEDIINNLNTIAMESPEGGDVAQAKYGGQVMRKIKKYPHGGQHNPPNNQLDPNYTYLDSQRKSVYGNPVFPEMGMDSDNTRVNSPLMDMDALRSMETTREGPLNTNENQFYLDPYRDGMNSNKINSQPTPYQNPALLQTPQGRAGAGMEPQYRDGGQTSNRYSHGGNHYAQPKNDYFSQLKDTATGLMGQYGSNLRMPNTNSGGYDSNPYQKNDFSSLFSNLRMPNTSTGGYDHNPYGNLLTPKRENGGSVKPTTPGSILGDFAAGVFGGAAASIPFVGSALSEGANKFTSGLGANTNSSAASFGNMAGGLVAGAINPVAGVSAVGNSAKTVLGSPALGTVSAAEDGGQFEADLEAENGEVVFGDITVNPKYNGGYAKQHGDLPIFTLGGKSHKQGGIGVNVQGEKPAYIFSNNKDLKVPKMYGKGGTYADAANAIAKELGNVSTMETGDVYDRNTANRVKPALMAKFEDLYTAQEDFKTKNGYNNPDTGYAHNGGESHAHPHGNGPTMDGDWMDGDFSEDLGLGTATNPNTAATNPYTAPDNTSPELPWQLYAANAIPGAFNMAKGLFGEAPKMELDRMDKKKYHDFNPLMDAYNSNNSRALALNRAGLEGSGGSGTEIRAGYQAMNSASQANSGQFYNQLADRKQKSISDTDQFNQGIHQGNQQMTLMEDNFALQNNPMNSFIQGMEQTVSAGTNLFMDNKRLNNMGTSNYDAYGNLIV